jgi:hypothetical protein
MKNKLSDLNDHLFAQLERLSDESITPEKLTLEIERSKAITLISNQAISNARLVLDAHQLVSDGMIKTVPAMLGIGNGT